MLVGGGGAVSDVFVLSIIGIGAGFFAAMSLAVGVSWPEEGSFLTVGLVVWIVFGGDCFCSE
eukprot:5965435-Ditylum_brightwellii.AAC.1